MKQFFIETDRLLLREFKEQDAPALFELDSNPLVHKYLGNQPLTHINQVYTYIMSVQQQYSANGIGRWITIEKSSNEIIGWSGLKFITEYENNHINFHDIGYRIIPRYWNKGYATEASKAALQFGFTTLNVIQIVGIAHTENKASRKVLENCGLQSKEQFISQGLPCDWLSISLEEWENLYNKR